MTDEIPLNESVKDAYRKGESSTRDGYKPSAPEKLIIPAPVKVPAPVKQKE